MNMNFIGRPAILSALSISFFLILWHGLASYLNTSSLPTPMDVTQVLINEFNSGQLIYHLKQTLRRLFISFSIAMPLGCAIGILLGRQKHLNFFFDNWLILFLNIPALVAIILCYVWFGLNEFAAITAVVINKLPNVIVTIREGTRAVDTELLEMATCYRFNKYKVLRHVIWPQLHPFLMAATRSGLALIWKIVLVVEMLGRSEGVGYQLNLFFQLFDVASILAYTVAFVSIIQVIEIFILKPIDQKSQRWRR